VCKTASAAGGKRGKRVHKEGTEEGKGWVSKGLSLEKKEEIAPSSELTLKPKKKKKKSAKSMYFGH